MGALVAFAPGARIWRWAAPPAALVLLTIAAIRRGIVWSDPLVQLVGYTAIALLFAALIARLVHGEMPRLRGSLEAPWICHIGKVSYGVYLLHWLVAWALAPRVQAMQATLGEGEPAA